MKDSQRPTIDLEEQLNWDPGHEMMSHFLIYIRKDQNIRWMARLLLHETAIFVGSAAMAAKDSNFQVSLYCTDGSNYTGFQIYFPRRDQAEIYHKAKITIFLKNLI